jgi:hypothetical protein
MCEGQAVPASELGELTEKGRRFVRWFAPIHFRLIGSFMSALSRSKARSLTRLLDEVRKQVRGAPTPEAIS